jgi:hypothetical protein
LLRPSVGQESGSDEDRDIEDVTGTEYGRKTGYDMHIGHLLTPSVGQASGSEEDSYFEWVTGTEYGRKTGCEIHKGSLAETWDRYQTVRTTVALRVWQALSTTGRQAVR